MKKHPYVTIIAYDATGYPLKQRRKSVESEKVTTLSFWGIPQKCEVIIKNKIESEILSFRIKTKKSTVNGADEEKFLKVHRDRSEIGLILANVADRGKYANRKYQFRYFQESMVANLLFTKNKEDKYTFNFPAEVLNSDPKGVERFKYSLKPYKGYYFTVANGNLNSRGEKSFYELDNRVEKRFYKGQEYELNPTKDTLAYIAYPVKKGDPTFYFKSGVVYMSNEPVEYFFPKYQLSKRDWLNLGNFFNRPYNLK